MKFNLFNKTKNNSDNIRSPEPYKSNQELMLIRYYNRVLTYPIRVMSENTDHRLLNLKKYINRLDYEQLINLSQALDTRPYDFSDFNFKESLEWYLTPLNLGTINTYSVTVINRDRDYYRQLETSHQITCLIYPYLNCNLYLLRPRCWQYIKEPKLPRCYNDTFYRTILFLDNEQQTQEDIKAVTHLIYEGTAELNKDLMTTAGEISEYVGNLISTRYTEALRIIEMHQNINKV